MALHLKQGACSASKEEKTIQGRAEPVSSSGLRLKNQLFSKTSNRTEKTAINYRENNKFNDTKYEEDLSEIPWQDLI